MSTQRDKTEFKCPKCKTPGSVTVAETDHPYNNLPWIDDVSEGFEAVLSGMSPKVTCKKCKVFVL